MTSTCNLEVAPLTFVRVTVSNDGPIPTAWNSVYVIPFGSARNPITFSTRPSLAEDRPGDTAVSSAVSNCCPRSAENCRGGLASEVVTMALGPSPATVHPRGSSRVAGSTPIVAVGAAGPDGADDVDLASDEFPWGPTDPFVQLETSSAAASAPAAPRTQFARTVPMILRRAADGTRSRTLSKTTGRMTQRSAAFELPNASATHWAVICGHKRQRLDHHDR